MRNKQLWVTVLVLVLVASGFVLGAMVLPGCVDSEGPSGDLPRVAAPGVERAEPVIEKASEPASDSGGIGQAVEESTEDYFVGSRKSDVYHYPGCHYVRQIKAGNLIGFDSVEEARARGYRPCKVCRPPG